MVTTSPKVCVRLPAKKTNFVNIWAIRIYYFSVFFRSFKAVLMGFVLGWLRGRQLCVSNAESLAQWHIFGPNNMLTLIKPNDKYFIWRNRVARYH